MTNFSERQKKQGALVRAYKLNGDEKAAHELFLSMKPFFEMRAKRMSDNPAYQQDFFSAYCEAFSYSLGKVDVDRAETFSGLVQLAMKETHKKVILHRNSPATGSVRFMEAGAPAKDSEEVFRTMSYDEDVDKVDINPILDDAIENSGLKERQKVIARMLLIEGMTFPIIAKEYGVSHQRIQDVHKKSLAKMLSYLKAKGIEFSDLL